MNTLAYADDLLLAAEDLRSLQMVLQKVEDVAKLGFSINAKKSELISWSSVPKEKKIMWRVQDSKAGIIKQLEYNETARYLGVDFDRRGVKTWNTFGKMKNLLKIISSAPLKPQRRIHLLTAFAQPKIFHQGTFNV